MDSLVSEGPAVLRLSGPHQIWAKAGTGDNLMQVERTGEKTGRQGRGLSFQIGQGATLPSVP